MARGPLTLSAKVAVEIWTRGPLKN
jgi:hypothetical protein